MNFESCIRPGLDPDFVPAACWSRAFQQRVRKSGAPVAVRFALQRPDGVCFHHGTALLPLTKENRQVNLRHLERTLKFLLWQRGAPTVWISGCDPLVPDLARQYSPQGERAFDFRFFGESVYDTALRVRACRDEDLPPAREERTSLGGHLEGCRIGFDLGGSDRKCAAVIDGEVVFSTEIPWNPYFESDPAYHLNGIRDCISRAAAHLPRVDAIGGSAAGVYVNNRVRVASLFRGVGKADFDARVREMFLDLQREWDVPFEVVNDGEVTALAGAMSLRDGAVLGISMGTSLAAGYCDSDGRITTWLNELAFAPVDLREEAPGDEWSGDRGCGVQFFSQQGVARLARSAGLGLPADMPLAEQLLEVQERAKSGERRATRVFETIGTCFGYALAHYADFYALRHVLILGRVTSGDGGQRIIDRANAVLSAEFPDLAEQLTLSMPDETMKRHGQAVAAASLPALAPPR